MGRAECINTTFTTTTNTTTVASAAAAAAKQQKKNQTQVLQGDLVLLVLIYNEISRCTLPVCFLEKGKRALDNFGCHPVDRPTERERIRVIVPWNTYLNFCYYILYIVRV
jgi:hypothetical protein